MAVTRPIKYAKHKSNNRVGWTIAIVWIISVGIGSPIVLGLNTSPQRTPELCIFYNSDFIIYSSLGSFYIPCLLMVFLYYRIFKAIHDRAKQSIGSSSSSKPIPSSGTAVAGSGVGGTVKPATSVGTKALGSGTQAIAPLSSGPSTIPVKTGSLVKPSGFGGVGKKNTSSCISSADAIVIENISLTARLKNNEESSFLGGEATISSASSSNVEVIGTGKERENDDGKEGEPSNRLSLIRERTKTGSDSHDCQEEEDESDDEGDDEDDEDGDSDDDLPGLCDSDIEAVECKVIKNKRTGRNNRECVVNVVQVDVTRTRNLDGNILEGTKLGEEIESEMKRKGSQQHQVGQATNIRNGNPDSGYVPSGGESESQFCVRNVHVMEEEEEGEDLEEGSEVMVDDIMVSDKRELSSFKLERDERGGGQKEEPSGKKGGINGEGIPSSFPLLPLSVVDGSSSSQRGTAYGQEDENGATMTTIPPTSGTVQLNAKEALVTAAARIHESSSLIPPLPTQATTTGPCLVVSNTTNIKTTTNTISQPSTVLGGGGEGGGGSTTIKKKSRFKLVGRSKRKTSSKKKKREKASAKRERKATKTLAIVLGTNSYYPSPITLFAFLLLLSPFRFPIPFFPFFLHFLEGNSFISSLLPLFSYRFCDFLFFDPVTFLIS